MKRAFIALLFLCVVFNSDAAQLPVEPAFVQRITSLRLPKIGIETASPAEAFSFVGRKVLERDPEPDPAARGISFFTAGRIPFAASTIKYLREDITVGELLQDMADLYGVEIHITSVGAIMTARGAAPFPNFKATEGMIFKSYKPGASRSAR